MKCCPPFVAPQAGTYNAAILVATHITYKLCFLAPDGHGKIKIVWLSNKYFVCNMMDLVNTR